MRAVVLVGGFGTRLRPLTLDTPKPLLPVANVRLLEHVLAALGSAGVTEAVLAIGFKPEPFFDAFPEGVCAGVKLVYAVEPEPMDTAGAIGFAARFAGIDDTFIVVNGDILTDVDYSSLVQFHRERGLEGTIHLIPVDDVTQFGVVELDASSRVTRFVEKPQPHETTSRFVNAGTYVLEASILDRIPEGQPLSIERVVFPAMVADGQLAAHPTNDYWVDTGRPETYLKANLDLIDGTRSLILASVAAQAHIDAAAVVTHSVVGDSCEVGNGAIVVDSVLLSGCYVGAGAKVERSLVMGRVDAGASVTACVIGKDGIVEAGAQLTDVKIP
ncbi:MAG: NDP-sugar synthase [Ilumatobacteraceae bacterium]|nr:NDP-sugar synthase [Ilumatobacteraceae bacterium]